MEGLIWRLLPWLRPLPADPHWMFRRKPIQKQSRRFGLDTTPKTMPRAPRINGETYHLLAKRHNGRNLDILQPRVILCRRPRPVACRISALAYVQ